MDFDVIHGISAQAAVFGSGSRVMRQGSKAASKGSLRIAKLLSRLPSG